MAATGHGMMGPTTPARTRLLRQKSAPRVGATEAVDAGGKRDFFRQLRASSQVQRPDDRLGAYATYVAYGLVVESVGEFDAIACVRETLTGPVVTLSLIHI